MGPEENALDKSSSSDFAAVDAKHDMENGFQSSQTDSTLDEKNEIGNTSPQPGLRARFSPGAERGRSRTSAAVGSQGPSRLDGQQPSPKEHPRSDEEDEMSTNPDNEAAVDDTELVYKFGKFRLRGEDDDLPQ